MGGWTVTVPVPTSPTAMPIQALPMQYELDGLTLGAFDVHDCWWIARHVEGWLGRPKGKPARTPRPQAPGSFRAAAFGGERVIGLAGSTRCPDYVTRLEAVERLEGIAGDPTRLYPFTVTDLRGASRTADVELDDEIKVRLVGPGRWFDWAFQLVAPDPNRYDAIWQQPRSTMIADGGPGLNFGATGLDFGTAGLDFGAPGSGLASQVANFGNARTYPIFEIKGPVELPRVTDLATGEHVDYAGSLYEGDVLTINCGEFPARGFPARSAFLNTYNDQRVLLTVPSLWPSVGPGEVRNFQLYGNGLSAAEMTVYLRSAWL